MKVKKLTLYTLLLCGAFGTANPAFAFEELEHSGSGMDDFSQSEEVSDDELGDMRGGFVTMNGLTIDFALSTRTIIDGVTQSDIVISSNNIDTITTENLKQIVQVGDGNQVEALNRLSQNPNIVVLVQNSLDNKVIQNINVLDIAVTNVSQFEQNSLTGMVDLGLVNALR